MIASSSLDMLRAAASVQRYTLADQFNREFYRRGLARSRYAADFKEEEHPRAADGQFAKKSEGEAHHPRVASILKERPGKPKIVPTGDVASLSAWLKEHGDGKRWEGESGIVELLPPKSPGLPHKLQWSPGKKKPAAPKPETKPPVGETKEAKSETKPLHTFPGEEGTEAVVHSHDKGFSVGLRDTDAGQTVQTMRIFPHGSEDKAIAHAKSLVRPPADEPATKPPADDFTSHERSKHAEYLKLAEEHGLDPMPIHQWAVGFRRKQEALTPAEEAEYKRYETMADEHGIAKRSPKEWVKNYREAQARKGATAHKAPTPAPAPSTKPPPPAPPPPKPSKSTNPHVALAHTLAARFKAGDTLSAADVFKHADEAHGGTRGSGKYGPSEAYDSLEAGFNASLRGETDAKADLASATEQAKQLAEKVGQLPTQTNRSGNKDAFQQFSTPPHYAFAVNWLANIKSTDTVLEPSAGTGCLAVHAANTGAKVIVNELDERRADFLKDQFGKPNVHTMDAEQIGALASKKGIKPTVVVMNPPFSQTAGRMGDKKVLSTAATHIDEALATLPEGGRLVAIVGRGMSPDSPTHAAWFKKIQENHNLRANVGVSGNEYKKYGTHFDTRVLVIDKVTPPKPKQPGFTGTLTDSLGRTYHFVNGKRVPGPNDLVTGDVDNIPDLMQTLEGVRNDRPGIAAEDQRASGEPESSGVSGPAGSEPDSADEPDRSVGVDLADGRGTGRPDMGDGTGGGEASPSVAAEGSDRTVGGQGDLPGGPAEPGSLGSPGTAPGRTGEQSAKRREPGSGGKGSRRKLAKRPLPEVARVRPSQKLTVQQRPPKVAAESQEELGESLYEQYRPASQVEGSKAHPSALVESAAMAATPAPKPTYQPVLSPDVVESLVSDAQLEAVIATGQAHQQLLDPDKDGHVFRRGMFIGDGTGTGKGREIAAVISDNLNQGRKRHLWVTQKQTLYEDSQRDLADLGIDPASLIHFDDIRKGSAPAEGTAFITYDTLKGSPKDKSKPSNLETLAAWLGPDFDGVIAFDEAHTMGNAIGKKGARGKVEPSQVALAGIALQQRLPMARVLYMSATGATEISNLAYAERLGIWGPGTPFADKQEFVSEMESGGVAAMEAIAQSLKATGSYMARSLSYDDGTPEGRVAFDRLTHNLTEDQFEQYNTAADAWQTVLQNIDKALELTGGSDCKESKKNASGQFWGAQQRFFNQVITSMQTPAVIEAMEKDIAEGRAPVVQLVNTMEAALNRQLDEHGNEVDDIDLSPKEILKNYLEVSFPIHRHESFVDADGNERSRLVETYYAPTGGITIDEREYAEGDTIPRATFEHMDAKQKHRVVREPVIDPAAEAMRDQMMEMVDTLRIPESPLDKIINHFGVDSVSECTGRSKRIVDRPNEHGRLVPTVESRSSDDANTAETKAFQDGEKKLLIFSGAAGTGRSYHASRKAKNQKQRVHYLLQPGWRADNAVQGFGRTHRTNQASAPIYRLVEIDELKAQKRFISTIARRLGQLGALTRGQRQAGSSGLFSAADNLESAEAQQALGTFFYDLERGGIEGLKADEVMKQLGFKKDDKEGRQSRKQRDPIPMSQFLNRMLALRVDLQGKVFSAFEERMQATVERALADGTLDTGVENFPATKLAKKAEQVVYREPKSGAEVKHFAVDATHRVKRRTWTEHTQKGGGILKYIQNERSGRVYSVHKAPDRTEKDGRVVAQYVLKSPNEASDQYKAAWEIDSRGGWNTLDTPDARKLWEQEYKEIPEFREVEEHFITGAMLPIWDRLGKAKPKIYRLRTEDGQTVVGRHVPKADLQNMLKSLGAEASGSTETHSPESIHQRLFSGDIAQATLANGWRLKKVRAEGESRIELKLNGDEGWSRIKELESQGIIASKFGGYQRRYFIPTGEDAVKVLAKIMANRPVTDTEVDAYRRDGLVERFSAALCANGLGRAGFRDFERFDFFEAVNAACHANGLGVERYRQDAAGHEHKGSGPGGGQFVSKGGGGESASTSRPPRVDRLIESRSTKRRPLPTEETSAMTGWMKDNGQRQADGSYRWTGEGGTVMLFPPRSPGFPASVMWAPPPRKAAPARVPAKPATASEPAAKPEPEKAKQPATDFGPGVHDAPGGRKIGVTQLKVAELSAAPERFQYKISGIGQQGVTEELKEVKKYRPEFGGQLLAWHDPKDGKTYVVNGHHRYELAKRSGYDGYMPCFLIDARDDKEARAIGALANIAEGRGTPLDAAKFFRESGKGPEDLRAEGISLKGRVADDGVALSNLSDGLFKQLAQGTLRESRALIVSRELGDKPGLQDQLAGIIAKREDGKRELADATVFELARRMKQTPTKTEKQSDLFGSWEDEKSLIVERAELTAAVRKELSEQATAFRAVSSEERAERLGEAGNVIATEENQHRANEARGHVWAFDKLVNLKGGLSDAFDAAAQQLAGNPKGKKALVRQLIPRIRELLTAEPGAMEAYRRACEGNPGVRRGCGNRQLGREGQGMSAERYTLISALNAALAVNGFTTATSIARYGGRWEESKHPRANDGRFGTKAGQHDGGDDSAKPAPGQMDMFGGPVTPKPVTATKKPQQPPSPPQRQTKLFDGLDALPGQMDLFDSAGNSTAQSQPAQTQRQEGAKSPEAKAATADDPTTPPPPGKFYKPDPAKGKAARVGVPGDRVPPPPAKIPRLPNLTPAERSVENAFAEAFEADPDGTAEKYRQSVYASEKPKVFETDGAKALSNDWTQPGQDDAYRKKAQALFNTVLHQTANAIAKRAFVKHLDEVAKKPEGQRHCLITAGGCGAGKGFALKKVGQVSGLMGMTDAVWDSAGDQNSTECEWVQSECKKRGIRSTFVYVHADPLAIWTNPERGVVQRAGNEGRMVDARVFADSHTHGARNFKAFADKVAGDPSTEIVYLDNRTSPAMLQAMPQEALSTDPEQLYQQSVAHLEKSQAPPHVKRGGTVGQRIWKGSRDGQVSRYTMAFQAALKANGWNSPKQRHTASV